jgi:hypothetical protein
MSGSESPRGAPHPLAHRLASLEQDAVTIGKKLGLCDRFYFALRFRMRLRTHGAQNFNGDGITSIGLFLEG